MIIALAFSIWTHGQVSAGEPRIDLRANSLLTRAVRVARFAESDKELCFGYDWLSNREIVFQRQGGYIRRNVKTGVEMPLRGCPAQDKTHWFGGNLMAEFTRDGKWVMWHGRRGNEDPNEFDLHAERTDGSKLLNWRAESYPELSTGRMYWFNDNTRWFSVMYETDRRPGRATGIVLGSVLRPAQARRIPFAGNVADWHVLGETRGRLLAMRWPRQRKPPAVHSLQLTELIIGTKVTHGRS